MSNFFAAVLALFTVLYMVLYLKVFIIIKYRRKVNDDNINVTVCLLRNTMVLYRMNIPIIEFTKKEGLAWLTSKVETTGEEGQAEHKNESNTHIKREERFIETILKYPHEARRTFRFMQYYVNLYRNFTNKITSSLKCESLYWNTTCGFSDAALTGILAGFFWTIKGMILNRLKKRMTLASQPKINVIPVFEHISFEVDFQCIFSVRIGNVITAAISMMKSKRKEVTNDG